MATTKKFENIFSTGRIEGLKVTDTMVRDFFIDKAQRTKLNKSPQKIVESRAAKAHAVIKPTPGKMLMYMYDAKHKETLPYFDKFPVIFPIQLYGDSFLGINLHYLPPVYRARLFDALFDTLNNQRLDSSTKMKISYDILNKAAKFKYFKPCVKKYLYSQVRSQLIEIPIHEWPTAMFLPMARFTKNGSYVSENKVWDDSVSKLMRG